LSNTALYYANNNLPIDENEQWLRGSPDPKYDQVLGNWSTSRDGLAVYEPYLAMPNPQLQLAEPSCIEICSFDLTEDLCDVSTSSNVKIN
jgi:hypothetical protein